MTDRAAAAPEPPPERNAPDWSTISLGIMTIATIVAATTAAAVISIVRDYIYGGSATVTLLAAGAAAVSLGAYNAGVVMGLSALFRETVPDRRRWTKRAAFTLAIQVGAVVAFTLIAIFGPLIFAAGGDAVGVQECPDVGAGGGSIPPECAPTNPPGE